MELRVLCNSVFPVLNSNICYRLPANRFFVWLNTLSSFQFSKIESTWAMKELLDVEIFRLGFSVVETNALEAIIAAGGGSAMPCGLVLPAARAKGLAAAN